ncbi:MAG TPA: DUF1178 family protein [Vicinamibacterales bacterium]
MIVYDLVCKHHHGFEGWFSSNEDFVRQRDAALIRCPLCDDAAVVRRPSAQVRVGHAPQPKEENAKVDGDAAKTTEVSMGGDADVLKAMRRLVADTENVGRAFAEEARKIHYEEAPKRGIRGQATPDEAEDLRDEGIDFMSLPAFLTRDLH